MVLKDKRGQAALVGVMIGIFVFMLAMVFINPIKAVIDDTRAVSKLDCENGSISDGAKMTCLIVDLIMPYFIAVIIAIAGAWVGAKFITG